MQATDFGNLHDPACLGELDGPDVRRIRVEREMRASPVIVGEVAGQDAAQVAFAENQNVIQTLASDRADEPLGERILPGAKRRCQDFTDAHALHALAEGVAVDGVAIAEEIGRGGIVGEGVHDLLGRPSSGGMLGNVEVEDAPAIVSEHDEDEQDAQARGRNSEEIEGDQIRDVMVRNVRQVCEGGVRRFGMSRETVRSATWKPSFSSSPWILGAPQRGLAAVIRVTRAAISGLTGGRPWWADRGVLSRGDGTGAPGTP